MFAQDADRSVRLSILRLLYKPQILKSFLLKFGTLMCPGVRTNGIDNGSDRSTSPTPFFY